MDIIRDRLKVIINIKTNLLDETSGLNKRNKRNLKELISYLEQFLFLEDGNLSLISTIRDCEELVSLFNNILKTGECSSDLKIVINRRLKDILSVMVKWLIKIKHRSEEIRSGNDHLKKLPQHSDTEKFYVMAKELNLNRHFLQHPINEVQLRNQIDRSNEELVYYDILDPIAGHRIFDSADSSLYPGSVIVIKNGHHRLFEIYRRYLQERIKGDALVQFKIEY